MTALTETELQALVAKLENHPDRLAQQLAIEITGAPVGTKAALGAGGLGGWQGGFLQSPLGQMLLAFVNKMLASRGASTANLTYENFTTSADDFRDAILRALPVVAAMARFTQTAKDDQAIAIAQHLFQDDVLFAKVKELLELK